MDDSPANRVVDDAGDDDDDDAEEDEDEDEEDEAADDDGDQDRRSIPDQARDKSTTPTLPPPPPAPPFGPVSFPAPRFADAMAAFSRPLLPPNASLISPKGSGGGAAAVTAGGGHGGNVLTPSTSSLFSPRSSSAGTAAGGGGSADHACRYRECLRNHAVRLGAHVLDGCGEFMPSPADALVCIACGCHRSFHRREPAATGAAAATESSSTRPSTTSAISLLAPAPHFHKRPLPAAPPLSSPPRPAPPANAAPAADGPSPKRPRTKFTAGQKELMRAFADQIGWKVKPKDGSVDEFCRHAGVSRRVLKVWMHNNKHLAVRHSDDPAASAAAAGEQRARQRRTSENK